MKVSGLTNASMRKKREAAVVALLLFFYVLLQSSTLSNDPWERMGAWRQSDTYSIALNFSQLRLNIFYPQLKVFAESADSATGADVAGEGLALCGVSRSVLILLRTSGNSMPPISFFTSSFGGMVFDI